MLINQQQSSYVHYKYFIINISLAYITVYYRQIFTYKTITNQANIGTIKETLLAILSPVKRLWRFSLHKIHKPNHIFKVITTMKMRIFEMSGFFLLLEIA
jgi:hypothetical protein